MDAVSGDSSRRTPFSAKSGAAASTRAAQDRIPIRPRRCQFRAAIDAAQFVLEDAEDTMDQRLLFLRRAGGQAKEQFRARPVVFHLDQSQAR